MPWKDLRVLVTGAHGGIGVPLCTMLEAAGANVIRHGKQDMDLASLDEVRGVELPAVDVLINNAGVGFGRDQTVREVSHDGLELRFAVNYLAAYALAHRLLIRGGLRAIVNVASAGQRALDFDDLQCERNYDGIVAYRRSKLAMVMMSLDLAELVPTVALHPGTFLDTGMVRESRITPLGTAESGAEAVERVGRKALSGVTGVFFDVMEVGRADPQAYDLAARAELRRRTEELLK